MRKLTAYSSLVQAEQHASNDNFRITEVWFFKLTVALKSPAFAKQQIEKSLFT